MKLHEEFKLYEDMWEPADITITSCDIEETVDHMKEWGRLPKLPYGWFIDDVCIYVGQTMNFL